MATVYQNAYFTNRILQMHQLNLALQSENARDCNNQLPLFDEGDDSHFLASFLHAHAILPLGCSTPHIRLYPAAAGFTQAEPHSGNSVSLIS